jgi:hypothetical protein
MAARHSISLGEKLAFMVELVMNCRTPQKAV